MQCNARQEVQAGPPLLGNIEVVLHFPAQTRCCPFIQWAIHPYPACLLFCLPPFSAACEWKLSATNTAPSCLSLPNCKCMPWHCMTGRITKTLAFLFILIVRWWLLIDQRFACHFLHIKDVMQMRSPDIFYCIYAPLLSADTDVQVSRFLMSKCQDFWCAG